MSIKGILFLGIVCVYLALVLRLRGSVLDRVIIFFLRTCFVLGLCLLLHSPRMDSVHREWKKPKFLILEDDSPSLRYQKELEDIPGWLQELSKHGVVQRKSFSDTAAPTKYSIRSQLMAIPRGEKHRGIFLISDGQEILPTVPMDMKTPVFGILRGKERFPDIHVSIKQFPREAYLSQKIVFRGTIHLMNASRVQGSLEVRMNGGVIREIPLNLDQKQTDFEFEHHFKTSGEKHFQVQFHSVLEEIILENNQVEFFIDVLKSRRLVYITAPSPGSDLAFYLRRLKKDPSLEVQVRYLKSKLYDQVKPSRRPELMIFYMIPYADTEEFLQSHKFSKVPRIYVIGSDSPLAASYHQAPWLQVIDSSGVDEKGGNTWEYDLHGHQFSPLNLYEHEGYQRTVLSSFPRLQEFSTQFMAGVQNYVPFELDLEGKKVPLVLVEKNGNPAKVVINAADLSRIPFSSFARERNLDFFDRMVGNLVEWCIDSTNLEGIDIHVPRLKLEEGDFFQARIQSWRNIGIRLMKRSGEIIDSGNGTLQIQRILPFGNYKLELFDGSQVLKMIPIHVGFGLREFEGAGRDQDNLREISDGSGGKLLDFPVDSLPSALGTALLEKKLELKRESVDLQKKILFALVLITMLCLEWIYRYSRRMI